MMDKPFQIPGLGAVPLPNSGQAFADMGQAMHWMQHMWSSYMNSPMAPTLDLDELDRRIKDLKAVEQWLSMNQNLLRTTIQGLEIQRTGIASLHAMMESQATPDAPDASKSKKPAPSEDSASTDRASQDASTKQSSLGEHPALEQATQWWGFLQKQFEQLASHASVGSSGEASNLAAKHDSPGPDASGKMKSDANKPAQAARQKRVTKARPTSKSKPGTSM